MDNGNYAFMVGAILRPQERLASVRKNAPDAQLREFSLGDQPRYKELASNEFLYITPQCGNPERVMMFFNWIYQTEENSCSLATAWKARTTRSTRTAASSA